MNPYLFLQKPRNQSIILIVVLVLILVIFAYFKGKKDDDKAENFKPSGVQPDTFTASDASQLAGRFHNAFYINQWTNSKGVEVKEVRAVLSQLKTADDVRAVADAFKVRKIQNCAFWCTKRNFGGFLSLVSSKVLNDYSVLQGANLN